MLLPVIQWRKQSLKILTSDTPKSRTDISVLYILKVLRKAIIAILIIQIVFKLLHILRNFHAFYYGNFK